MTSRDFTEKEVEEITQDFKTKLRTGTPSFTPQSLRRTVEVCIFQAVGEYFDPEMKVKLNFKSKESHIDFILSELKNQNVKLSVRASKEGN
jgi:hypothetical protein